MSDEDKKVAELIEKILEKAKNIKEQNIDMSEFSAEIDTPAPANHTEK